MSVNLRLKANVEVQVHKRKDNAAKAEGREIEKAAVIVKAAVRMVAVKVAEASAGTNGGVAIGAASKVRRKSTSKS